MWEYILTIGVTLALKTVADVGVKYSKSTHNTVDDAFFENLKKLTNILQFKSKK